MPPPSAPTLSPCRLRWAVLAPLAAAALVACGGGGGGNEQTADACPETGTYACKSGETEPLYTFQWALNYAKSWFADNADVAAYGGGMDLNVEPVHRQGIKGQGVNVLVIDTGVDLENEDLKSNADYSMSWNFETSMKDPNPLLTGERSAHGTSVAGIIGAAQNGKGVMGMAPLVKLGGVASVLGPTAETSTAEASIQAYGNAPWSRKAHVINGSYGATEGLHEYSLTKGEIAAIRGLKSLRNEKGIVFVKSAGNEFNNNDCMPLRGAFSCVNPANDIEALEPNVIVTAALNAKGQASSYSSAGSVVWITGMGGEGGHGGRYGEKSQLPESLIAARRTGNGPTIFSTDIRGCEQGSSRTILDKKDDIPTEFMKGKSERNGVKDNPNCDYAYMNGTSAAAPTITGVVALMLSANPDLSWRDVRDILKLSARAADQGYEKRARYDLSTPVKLPFPYNALFDLKTNSFTTQQGDKSSIVAGASQVPMELGWTTNAAGNQYSNWYGFGVPDAAKAVELAKLYKKEPQRSRSAAQVISGFQQVQKIQGFKYQQVSLIGEFTTSSQIVDEFQVRLSAENICLGSFGIAVQSPSGAVSLLKLPLDHFYKKDDDDDDDDGISKFTQFGLGSYAFYGEDAKGTWKIYALASNPLMDSSKWGQDKSCGAAPADGLNAANANLLVEARVIAQ